MELQDKRACGQAAKAEQRGEYMHVIRFLISYVMVTILGVIMLLFLALNHPTVKLDLLDAQYYVSLPWIMGGAAVFGFLVALLMLLPGRIAAMMNTWALERELRDVEHQYEEMQVLRARLLADHEALVERHERMLIRFQHLVTDHREAVAEHERTRRQIAAPNAVSAASVPRTAQPAPSPAGRSGGIRSALRLLPPAAPAPAPAAPAPAASPTPAPRASAAPPQVQAPTTPAVAGATAREVRTEQPAAQERVQPPAELSTSQVAVAPAPAPAVAAPPPAPAVAAPSAVQPKLVPVLTSPPASSAQAKQAPAQAAEASQKSRKPLVGAHTLRRPVERLRDGARQGWQRAGVETERLRERMAVLRANVGARLQQARASDTLADAAGTDEPTRIEVPALLDDD